MTSAAVDLDFLGRPVTLAALPPHDAVGEGTGPGELITDATPGLRDLLTVLVHLVLYGSPRLYQRCQVGPDVRDHRLAAGTRVREDRVNAIEHVGYRRVPPLDDLLHVSCHSLPGVAQPCWGKKAVPQKAQ
jgi:hypothetical protein